MTTQAMDVFSLRDHVVREYERFATSFTKIHAPDIRAQVDAIYAGARYWPEPLIQINPAYLRTASIGALVADGTLDPGCAAIFRSPPSPGAPTGEPLTLYEHQRFVILEIHDAMAEAARTGRPYATLLDPPPGDPRVAYPPRPETAA